MKVAVLREEGSNGDREMAAALYAAGMEPWDVSIYDLIQGTVALEDFRGLVFVGGFSYADVMDSAKGWAGTIKFNAALSRAFRDFYARPDTWSLGVCNGCQLMSLLGFVPGQRRAAARSDQPLPQRRQLLHRHRQKLRHRRVEGHRSRDGEAVGRPLFATIIAGILRRM